MSDLDSRANKVKLTILSNLLTFVSGIAVVLPFVVKSGAASDLNVSLTKIGYVLAFFMLGMVACQLVNGFFVKYLTLKTEVWMIFIVNIICVLSLYLVSNTAVISVIMLVMGFVYGIGVTVPFYIMNYSFKGRAKSIRMNLLDLFFGIGSCVFPAIAGVMLANNCDWKTIYVSVFIVWFLIVIFLCITKMPDVNTAKDDTSGQKSNFSPWIFNVYLIGFAIFCSFVSFMGFNYWIIPYLRNFLHIKIEVASLGLSLFWMFYAGGCFVATLLLKWIPVNRYIIGTSIVAILSYLSIINAASGHMFLISVSCLGLGCGSIYGSCISFGTLLLEKPSPRLVSFFIFSSGIGTYFAEFYSSWIQSEFGVPLLMKLSCGWMILVFIIISYVSISQRMKYGKQNLTEF